MSDNGKRKKAEKKAGFRPIRGREWISGILLAVCAAAAVILAAVYSGMPKNVLPAVLCAVSLFTAFTVMPEHRAVTGLRTVVSVFACFYLLEWFTHQPWKMAVPPQVINLLFAGAFLFLFTGVTGRFTRGLAVLGVFYLFTGLANFYTMKFRSSPILPWDLLSVRTALSVTANYTFSVTWEEACIALGFLILLGLCRGGGDRKLKALPRILSGAAGLAAAAVLVVLLGQDGFSAKWLTKGNLFTQWATYRDNGFFVSFGQNLKYLRVKKPAGYSREKADEVIRAGAAAWDAAHPGEGGTGVRPHILVIMNEAFSDLSVLHEFGTDADYMPFFRSLQETPSDSVLTGTLYVSVLGGNTANTEYEFLTGGSMAFLPPGSVPYQQYINDSIPSLVKELEGEGYRSFAVHPYLASGWDRDEVYPFMGFDDSWFKPAFKDPEIIRKYISDAAQYEFVMGKMKELGRSAPLFSYNVTMQNHGGYSQLYDDLPLSVHLTDISNRPGTEHYLTLIQRSDASLREFCRVLAGWPEPVVLVFFGDHQPSDFVASCIQNKDKKNAETRTLEEQQKRYEVPFLIWSNRPLSGVDTDTHPVVSANWLGALTARAAGLELTDHQKYLLWMWEQYPAVTANIVMKPDGTMFPVGEIPPEDEGILGDYEMVCYRLLFDTDPE